MNLLFVSDIPFNPYYGGIERITDSLVRALLLRGYNIHYLCGKVIDFKMLDYDFPVSIVSLPDKGLFRSQRNVEFYISYIQNNKIDIVINQRGLEREFNASLIKLAGVKYISVIHSTPLAYMYAAIYSNLFPSNNRYNKLKGIIKTCIKPIYKSLKIHSHKILQKNHYSELFKNSNRVVLLSRKFQHDFQFLNIDVPLEKIVAIPNPNSFPKQELDLNSKKNIILFSGRLSPEKNPLALLKAWEIIAKQLPSWELWFVGDGSMYYNLNNLIAHKKLERVKLCGRCSNMIDYYLQAKIICLTSFYEGWGMALTEGMQCGCVPVAFNSYASVSDIIDDGANGLLVAPFNVKELSRSLFKLASNDALFKKYARASYAKSLQYDISRIVDKWQQIFQSL